MQDKKDFGFKNATYGDTVMSLIVFKHRLGRSRVPQTR